MTKKIDWYDEFVDLRYTSAKDDLICLYYFEPAKGMSEKEAAGRIASESSAGTWTTLHKLPERVAKIKARAFHIEGKYVKVRVRPLTGAVPKPKIGFSAAEHSQVAYETWMGGFDLVKDDAFDWCR